MNKPFLMVHVSGKLNRVVNLKSATQRLLKGVAVAGNIKNKLSTFAKATVDKERTIKIIRNIQIV